MSEGHEVYVRRVDPKDWLSPDAQELEERLMRDLEDE